MRYNSWCYSLLSPQVCGAFKVASDLAKSVIGICGLNLNSCWKPCHLMSKGLLSVLILSFCVQPLPNRRPPRLIDRLMPAEVKLLPHAMLQSLLRVFACYRKEFPAWFMPARVWCLSKVFGAPCRDQATPISIPKVLYRLWASMIRTVIWKNWAKWFALEVTGPTSL